jgi:hypothetical protein
MPVGRVAWSIGHCIVLPVRVGDKSMALVGSVVTKDSSWWSSHQVRYGREFAALTFQGALTPKPTVRQRWHFSRPISPRSSSRQTESPILWCLKRHESHTQGRLQGAAGLERAS